MKKNFAFFLLTFFFFSNSNISFSIEPDVFIQSTVNRAANTLEEILPKMKELNN